MYQVINYYIGGKAAKMHLVNGREVSERDVETMRAKNFKKGYAERMIGFYDKWYRCNAFDGGESYDGGVAEALKQPDCVPDCQIIECAGGRAV
jgi:hypothetical protein